MLLSVGSEANASTVDDRHAKGLLRAAVPHCPQSEESLVPSACRADKVHLYVRMLKKKEPPVQATLAWCVCWTLFLTCTDWLQG